MEELPSVLVVTRRPGLDDRVMLPAEGVEVDANGGHVVDHRRLWILRHAVDVPPLDVLADLDGLGEERVIDPLGQIFRNSQQDNPLAAQHATRERNLLVIELRARVRDLRAAARFVFRHEPEVIRAFTSAYGRRRRRASRAKKRAAPPPT